MYNPNTTDNQEEVFDVVNLNDEVIGTATRKQVHADPSLIHRAAGGYIFNSKKELLMQKRSLTKDMYPGYWVFSVGGHVNSGETYDSTVKREIQEELGVDIKMYFLEKVLQQYPEESEFWQTYIGVFDGPFPQFNTVEIEELRYFSLPELVHTAESNSLLLPPTVKSILPKVQNLVESGKVDALLNGIVSV